jgi:hypothetical protein
MFMEGGGPLGDAGGDPAPEPTPALEPAPRGTPEPIHPEGWSDGEKVSLPDLTTDELKQMGGEQAPEQKFSFKYGDQEFGSQEDLTKYIAGLQRPEQPQGMTAEDVQAAIQTATMKQQAEFQQMLESLRQPPPAQEGKTPPQQNPYDPEASPNEHRDWEVERRLEAATLPLHQRLEEMQASMGQTQERLENERLINTFEAHFDREAKEEGVDPRWSQYVKDLVIQNENVDTSNWANVRQEIGRVWRPMKSLMDQQQSEGVETLMKTGKKFPPSVARGASTPVFAGGQKEEPVKNLGGKDSTYNFLRRNMTRPVEE